MKTINQRDGNKAAGKSRTATAVALLMGIAAVGQQASAAVSAIKADVVTDGLYAISSSNLAVSFGVSEAQVVAWLQSQQLAVENEGEPVAALFETNRLTFFARSFVSKYTDKNVYWIRQAPGYAMGAQSSAVATVTSGKTFPSVVNVESNVTIRPDLFTDANADPALWQSLNPVSTFTKTLTSTCSLPGVVTGRTLVVRILGAADKTNTMSIVLNGVTLGSFAAPISTYVAWTASVASVALNTNGNVIKITAANSSGGLPFVDNYTINYSRAYHAAGGELVFTANSNDPITVSGFASSAIELYNVTSPGAEKKVTGLTITGGGTAYSASFRPTDANGRYVIVGAGYRRAPVVVTADVASDLHASTNACDYVAIAASNLVGSAQTLSGYRSAHGLIAKTVALQDIYDEFNYGIADPRAIRAFLGFAHRMWSRAPRYAVLVGQGSLDYRNYKGLGDCLVPSLTLGTLAGLIASDVGLADFDNDGAVDMAIGRLPVITTNEFNNTYKKIQDYEAGGTWKTKAVGLADVDEPQSALYFSSLSDGIYSNTVGMSVDKVYATTQTASSARSNTLVCLNSGRGLFTYVGQANDKDLGKQSGLVLLSTDVTNLVNVGRPSLMIGLTCYVGSLGGTGSDSMGEKLVATSNGAVAVYGSGALTFAAGSQQLGEPITRNLYGSGANNMARLGDAIVAGAAEAIVSLGSNYYVTEACKAYNLLGDPALAVGDINSGRGGPLTPTNTATYAEWQRWAIAPVLADQGVGANPNADDDGDGVSNNDEFFAGTDATDVNSRLAVVHQSRNGGQVTIKWNSAQHRIYQLERTTNLLSQVYAPVGGDSLAMPPLNTYTDSVSPSAVYIYRVRVKQAGP